MSTQRDNSHEYQELAQRNYSQSSTARQPSTVKSRPLCNQSLYLPRAWATSLPMANNQLCQRKTHVPRT
jgi:hypothetical protein